MNTWTKKSIQLTVICMLAASISACSGKTNNETTPGSNVQEEQSATNAETNTTEATDPETGAAGLDEAFTQADQWQGQNDKLTFDAGYVTFSGGNVVSGYAGASFLDEQLAFKTKVKFNTGNWAYFTLRSQQVPSEATWSPGIKQYALFVKKDGTVTFEKWVDGTQTVLQTVENTVFLDEGFHKIEFGAQNTDGGVKLTASFDGEAVIEAVDTDNPILEAGYWGAMVEGDGQLAIGGVDAGAYNEVVVEEAPNLEVKDVAVVDTKVNLLQSKDNWQGWLPNITVDQGVFKLTPDKELGQFQAGYTSGIFGNTEFDVKFQVNAIGEWVMFYLRHVTADIRSAAWGSSEFGPSDTYSLLMDKNNKIQLLKWKNGSPVPLLDLELDSSKTDLKNSAAIQHLNVKMEEIEKGGKAGMNFTIVLNGQNIATVNDFDNPFTNPGYFTVHGYEGAELSILELNATPISK